MKPTLSFRHFLALSGSVMLLVTQSHAANYYWDSNGNTAGLGDTAGTWGAAASPGWGSMNAASSRTVILGTQSTANTAIAVGDTVYFGTMNLDLGSAASTIGITGAGVQANRIVFGLGQGSQGITLSGGGGAITLSNANASIIANNTGINTIGAVLNGTTGLLYGGSGTTVLTEANGFTGGVTVTGGGTLQVGDGIAGSLTSQNLTFRAGAGGFNVLAASTGSTQAMGTLTFANTGATAGEGTVQSTYGTSGNAELSFSSLAARQGGATGNFVVSGGTNGTTNKIVLTGVSSGFIDRGLYFGGNSFAAYDAAGFVRSLIYGTDTDAAATDTITADNHVQLTSSPVPRPGDSLLSLHLAGGGVDYTMDSGTLTVSAILKTGGGAASTISGGASLTTLSNAEPVIRTDTASDSLTISTAITGTSGGLTKTGKGTLTLTGSNGYTGVTRVLDGTLVLSGGSAIADTQQILLADAPDVTLQLNSSETVANVYGGGFSGGTVNVQGSTLTYSANTNIAFGGTYTGTASGGIIKQGTGTLTLSNTNQFVGEFTLEGGAVEFTYGNDGTAPLIPLSSGGAFNMANGTTLRFNPTQNFAWGTIGAQLQSANGGSPPYPYGWVFANDITITDGIANIRTTGNENTVRFTGDVTGGSSGSQTLAFYSGGINAGSGDRQANTFTGTIQNGSGGTLGVNIDFFGASGTAQGAFVNLSGHNTFTGPIVVTNSKGLSSAISGNGGFVGIGGEIYSPSGGGSRAYATGTGHLGGGNYTNTISLAAGTILTYLSSANQAFGGEISGDGQVLLEGTTTGTLTLSATNSYTGATTVRAGTLLVNNTTGSGTGTGNVDVTAGTLGGTGSISGAVTLGNGSGTADATLAPGTSTASLATGDLAFASDGRYTVDLDGTAETSGQIAVTGTVTIHAAATLVPSVTGTLAASQQYPIISNDGADAVTGTFAGLAQDAVVGTFGGTDLKISYTGGDGNDVVLYTEGSGTPYSTWAGAAAFTDDANGDGIDNGLAWILGADSPTDSALDKLPVVATSGGFLTLSFTRENPYSPAKLYVEYGDDLAGWTKLEIPAATGTIGDDIELEVTTGPPDSVLVKIPTNHGGGGKLFARLSATEN
jgi:autotransporter-associated beta strand protein